MFGATLLDTAANTTTTNNNNNNFLVNLPNMKPLGGAFVGEFAINRGNEVSDPNSKAFLRLQTVVLSNQSQAQVSDTQVRIVLSQTARDESSKGLSVELNRGGTSILEFSANWDWPIRITVYDARTGIELGKCIQQLHNLLSCHDKNRTKTIQVNDRENRLVCEIELDTVPGKPLANKHLLSENDAFRNVCIAVDFSCTSFTSQPTLLLQELSKLVELFDSKQTYTPWGFGAKIQGKVRTIFQCGKDQRVSGTASLLGAYKFFLSNALNYCDTTSRRTLINDSSLGSLIRAASLHGRVLVILSDFANIDIKKLCVVCDQNPNLFVILTAIRTGQNIRTAHPLKLPKNVAIHSVNI